ncbi:MAG: 4-hydroxy-3-methylbut-2-enyl diphosphate reductase [Spirochaetae bacterium HGW-Spirochaetae-5]|nr:MAG: 4-hydroxy-3-methylbut-2-enyl diphosphate reductase [Spirochaetae bacterium HGW-Spirochaetae-5]
MKIEMAKNSGFCMGVRKALLRIVDELNSSEEKIYMYGPLIHNPQTIEVLKNRGLITINSLDTLENRQIAIRTHGIPVDENKRIRSSALRTINLTCSRVARVQSIIKKYSGEGYYTIIIGDRNHAEVVGLKSYARAGVHIVSDAADIDGIESAKKYIVVSQTTHERDQFDQLVAEISKKINNVYVIDTICDSTRLRQDDVKNAIKKGIDTLVVVGGKNSANTSRLVKIGVDSGVKTFHIETDAELKKDDFKESKYVLVTAGASTPGWIINNVLEKLYIIKSESSNFIVKSFKHLIELLIRSNIVSSLASLFMVLLAQLYAGIALDIRYGVIASFYIFVMYSVNNYLDRGFLIKSNSYKYQIYEKYGSYLLMTSIILFFVSIYLAMKIFPSLAILILVPYLFGLVYSTSVIKKIIKKTNSGFLKKLYNTKIITGLGWLVVVIIIPYFRNGVPWEIYLSSSLFFFVFVFTRHLIIDFAAFQGDLILGRDTLPTWLGVRNVINMTYLIIIISSMVFAGISIAAGKSVFIILLLCTLYYTLLLKKIQKTDYLISLRYEFIIDLNYILLAVFFYVIIFSQAL